MSKQAEVMMQYTAIVKNGGLFIPNIINKVNSDTSQPQVIQIELDIAQVYKQLQTDGLLTTKEVDNTNTPTQKVSLGDTPIKAFETITDPVAWQNSLREEW